jgi:hypothetical protein
MKTMANVKWNRGEKNSKTVNSEAELISLIQDLDVNAKNEDYPISVEIKINEETVFSLVVGMEISALHFFDQKSGGKYSVSEGEESLDGWVSFFMQDHFSEMPRKNFVPSSSAMDAVKEYYRSGKRPTNINWSET